MSSWYCVELKCQTSDAKLTSPLPFYTINSRPIDPIISHQINTINIKYNNITINISMKNRFKRMNNGH